MPKLFRRVLLTLAILCVVTWGALALLVAWTAFHASQDEWFFAAFRGDVLCSAGEPSGTAFPSDMPSYVRAAFVAAETDAVGERFPAAWTMPINVAMGGRLQRADPFTAGVVRCLLATEGDWRGRTLEWHVKGAVLTVLVDEIVPKELILDSYLNVVPLGPDIRGIEAASVAYFAKEPADLTVAEAAYLAGLARAPLRFAEDDKLGLERRNVVLARMRDAGEITPMQYEVAAARPLGRRRGAA
ncbi:MAG: transglycosylase domain-containing protein [Bacteroidales bacterium]